MLRQYGRLLALVGVMLLISTRVMAQASVASSAPFVECGHSLTGEFTEDFEEHFFQIALVQGDELNLEAQSLEREGVLKTTLAIYEPEDDRPFITSNKHQGPKETMALQTGILTTHGDFYFKVVNSNVHETGDPINPRGGAGRYELRIGCVMRDGRIINPGDIVIPPAPESEPVEAQPDVQPAPAFSGFGFPGIEPVDFSAGIEVPLTIGQSTTVPVGNDIALYTFEGTAGSAVNIVLIKLTQGVSVGVTVIHQGTNEVIFIGGMPHTDSLITTLNLPADGTYAIGLFGLDTPTMIDTTGAIQLTVQQ